MSNQQVGQVYMKIIEEVIDGSASTFDEDGVERQLLDDLRKTWQAKLTERHVASMPWDPAPAPAPLPQNTSTSSIAAAAAAPASQPASSSPPVKPEPAIKTEPQTQYIDYNVPQQSTAPTYSSNPTAMQRAGQHLQDKFGTTANSAVHQLQATAQARVAAQRMGPMGMPGATPLTEEQRRFYNQQIETQLQQQQATRMNPQQRVSSGQTDGADEWALMVEERRALSDEAVLAADITIHQRVEQMAKDMEGGGLMLPASQQKKRVIPLKRANGDIPQYDGNLDSEEEKAKVEADEDAINSELDDPDDDVVGETEDEGNSGELMLCTYDKVQRVKNKWKCTLKDGVLTTGGKEYLFNKAQGEFEW